MRDEGFTSVDHIDIPRIGTKDDLPSGIVHGTMDAVRKGCLCQKCLDKRSRMRRHGNMLTREYLRTNGCPASPEREQRGSTKTGTQKHSS